MNPICHGCTEIIFDRFFLQIKEYSFHEDCLFCHSCQRLLDNVCYLKNGRIFCKGDYDRTFRSKCAKCHAILYPEDLVIRNQQKIYHYTCFTCSSCGLLLQQGDEYLNRGGEVICKAHFQKDECIPKEECNTEFLSEITRHRDGRRGPKRPRTILTAMQRRQFKASFEISPKPCRKVREALAKETGLSVRVVQVWFQNQRAKMKKMQRRGKISMSGAGSPDAKTSAEVTDDFTDDSDDDFGSTDQALESQSSHEGGESVNPIDKLYMMQDSYFSQP